MSGEYIDVTPTWYGIVFECLRVLPHTTPEGRRDIHVQILKAARVADLHVAQVDAGAVLLDALENVIAWDETDPDGDGERARDIRAAVALIDKVRGRGVEADQEEEPNPYTLCAACQGTAHEDEGYTVKGQTVCLGCYHEHSAGLNIFNLELLRGPE